MTSVLFPLLSGKHPKCLILADSITKDLYDICHTDIITKKGADVTRMHSYVAQNPQVVQGYNVITLHIGTNWLSKKEEWFLYLDYVNNQINQNIFLLNLSQLDLKPAIGQADQFQKDFLNLINTIQYLNSKATILISSILPRKWDFDRRDLVRQSYNSILQNFNKLNSVYYIKTSKPFFYAINHELRSDLFNADGLHLNDGGSRVLRTILCDKIAKALQDKLK